MKEYLGKVPGTYAAYVTNITYYSEAKRFREDLVKLHPKSSVWKRSVSVNKLSGLLTNLI